MSVGEATAYDRINDYGSVKIGLASPCLLYTSDAADE